MYDERSKRLAQEIAEISKDEKLLMERFSESFVEYRMRDVIVVPGLDMLQFHYFGAAYNLIKQGLNGWDDERLAKEADNPAHNTYEQAIIRERLKIGGKENKQR